MDRSVSVRTPESISFSYELAGLGSRFLALAFDMFVQVVLFFGILWAITLIASHAGPQQRHGAPGAGAAESFGIAIIVTIVFVLFFGYFIAFEGLWNGATPGKKLLGIRVVRDGGYPLDLGASFIRNVIRIGELALAFYAVSALITLLSPENKRLGDMAAGTLVVRDSRVQQLHAILEKAEVPEARAAMLSQDEHAIIDRFIARRSAMAPQARRELAFRIADRVRKRVSSDLQRLDDEDLLERLSVSS